MRALGLLLLLLVLARGLGVNNTIAQSTLSLHALFNTGGSIWQSEVTLFSRTNVTEHLILAERNASLYSPYVPQSPAAAFDSDSSTLWTMTNVTGGWRVCRWDVSVLPLGPPKLCSAQDISEAGDPTSLIYLGDINGHILVAFPEAGDIVSISADSLVPWVQKWATGLESPVSLAFNAATDTVYIALIDGDAVVRFDSSGSELDQLPSHPWLSVPRPRFILLDTANQQLMLYVLCSDTTMSELYMVDSAGNSVGSIADESGVEWICDEPGQDADGNDTIARIISVAIENDYLYVVREGGYNQVDSYGLVNHQDNSGAAQLYNTLLDSPVALLTENGNTAPIGIIDSYELRINGQRLADLLDCSPGYASGHTLPKALGAWQCRYDPSTVMYYDSRSVYTLYVSTDNHVCFSFYSYLGTFSDPEVVDTYFDGEHIFILRADGSVVKSASPCDDSLERTSELVKPLDPSLLALPNHDFFTRASDDVACISTQQELACADGLLLATIPVCQELMGGAPLSGPVTTIYSAALDGLLVSGSDVSGALYVELHKFVSNSTALTHACLGPLTPQSKGGSLAFVTDGFSGVFGWIDTRSGLLMEVNTETGGIDSVATITLPPVGAFQWTLRDADGQAVRFPAPPPNATIPATKPPKTDGGMGVGSIMALVIAGLILCCVCIVLAARLRRVRRTKDGDDSYVHTEGNGSTAYSLPVDETQTFFLPAWLRRIIRNLCCFTGCVACCYNPATGRLWVGSSWLGGKLPTTMAKQPYAQMLDGHEAESGLSEMESLPGRKRAGSLDLVADDPRGGVAQIQPTHDVGTDGAPPLEVVNL